MATPANRVDATDTPASRARYYDPENFFAFRFPEVPRRQFVAERDAAFAADGPTGEILLDASDVLETSYPATTPFLLARYLRIRPAESMRVNRRAAAEIFYVLRGTGTSNGLGETIGWGQGDVFCFPGGVDVDHRASTDAVLFTVCNEPLLSFDDLYPSGQGHARVAPLHWSKAEIDANFANIDARPDSKVVSGRALQLASAAMAPATHPIPSMNVAINTLKPGLDQRPHRHNGAAITLAIQADSIHSMIEDQKVDWALGAAQVTPAADLHSHHNRGSKMMVSLVVQDEGLHFYARTPGFSWT
ncbi:MAG: gentisate 1,2-dioxygenase [Gammaproteobacteria bacterium]|jgi:gentisate 1,2-dioxygenase